MDTVADEVNPKPSDQTVVTTEEITVKTGSTAEAVGEPQVERTQSSVKTTTQPAGTTKPLIMQGLVSQPTAMPTNKHMAYTGGILLGMLINAIVDFFFPEALPPGFWTLFPPFLGWMTGYMVKDSRNA